MTECLITSEEFTSYLSEIQKAMSYQRDLNKLYDKYQIGICDDNPDCVPSLIQLLNKVMHVSAQDRYIERFCYDTNFGKKKADDIFYDVNMKPVIVNTPDDLYRLLLSLYSDQGNGEGVD